MRFPRSTLCEFSQYERLGPLPSTPYVCSDAIPLGESRLHETCKYNIFVVRCYCRMYEATCFPYQAKLTKVFAHFSKSTSSVVEFNAHFVPAWQDDIFLLYVKWNPGVRFVFADFYFSSRRTARMFCTISRSIIFPSLSPPPNDTCSIAKNTTDLSSLPLPVLPLLLLFFDTFHYRRTPSPYD
jgi:hypothetical protein